MWFSSESKHILAEEIFVGVLAALGIGIATGLVKVRKPWMRGGAVVFTVISQTIWERDRQIGLRRTLVELANNNRK
jgi:hypothetical protein